MRKIHVFNYPLNLGTEPLRIRLHLNSLVPRKPLKAKTPPAGYSGCQVGAGSSPHGVMVDWAA